MKVQSAFATESQAYVFRYTGDNAEGVVIVTQGTKAILYDCPVLAFMPVILETTLRLMCKTENAARPFNNGAVADYFMDEKKFAFARTHVSPTRFQHGEVSEHLISSGMWTESKVAYFDLTHPDWMFENGITSFVSLNDNDEANVYSRFGSTFVLLRKEMLDFSPIPAGLVVPSLKY